MARALLALLLLSSCGSVSPEPETTEPVAIEPVPIEPVPIEPVTPPPETPVVTPEEPDAGPLYPGIEPDDPALSIDPLTAEGSVSTSVGGPNAGSLLGGVPLPVDAPGLFSNPRRPNATAYWGTVELVRSLMRAAAVVDRELPGSRVSVNDVGFREGGRIPHHGSHTAGRDVDVLFYLFDMDGAPRPGIGAPIGPDGVGTDFGDLMNPDDDVDVRIDVPRTWRFVQALLEDEDALVQRIFVVEHLRTMLLAHAEAIDAPQAARSRFADVTCQPSYPHDDHLHVRFFCTDEDLGLGCADGSPMYPWRRAQLRAAGVEPVTAGRTPRSRSTTAEPEEPPMHERVRAFLDLRETWATQPHPGRPYCR